MKGKIEKCPLCGFPKKQDCGLMASVGEDKNLVCCCDVLQMKSVKK